MICPKCGTQLNDGAAFCPKCGNRIENNTTNNVPNQPMENNVAVRAVVTETAKEKHSTWKTVLITVLATIVAGFTGLMILGSKSTVPETKEVSTSEGSVVAEPEGDSNAPEVSDLQALNELLGYIDQAEEVVQKYNNDYEALKEEENLEIEVLYRNRADIIQATYSELEVIRDNMVQIKDLDPTVKEAGTEYFNMIISSRKSWYEVLDFMTNYYKLYYNIFVYRPQESDSSDVVDYYNSLYSWYQSAMEGIDAIESYPTCVETEWERYKEVVGLNKSIVQKEYIACELNDWLRHYSAKYMSGRYEIAEENAYNEIVSCIEGEIDFARNQQTISSNLAEEIHGYADMDEDARSNYEFKYNRANKIILNYEAVDTIYPSLFNTYDAFVIFKTGCISGTRKIVIEAEIPGFTQKYKQSFNLDASYKTIYIKPAALTGDLDLSSAKDAQINISIFEGDGITLIDSKTFPVTIKSRNDFEWTSTEFGDATQDNILCFLTPESSSISELKRTAIDELYAMTSGKMEIFPGYQTLSSDPNSYLSNPYAITYLQAAGIMRALNEVGVRYNLDGFSISGSNQHILLPKEVLEKKKWIVY